MTRPSPKRTCELKIFLSGSVQKGDADNRDATFFWSDDEEEFLRRCLPESDVRILNPNKLDMDPAQYMERFRADLEMMLKADLVLVDVRTKKGLGVGAELMLAQYEGIPVVGLCPEGTAYRRDGRLHAFVAGLVPHICDDLEDVISWIREQIQCGNLPKPRRASEGHAPILFGLSGMGSAQNGGSVR